MVNVQPIKQKQHKWNPNCALKVRKDLNKLLDTIFIYLIETTQWLSLLVIVPKKNGKLHICVDYWKLNAQTKKDPFPLPFWIQFLIQWQLPHKQSCNSKTFFMPYFLSF
jgi:hypothetical protein